MKKHTEKIKIVYVSGTRADYGLMRRTLLKLDKRADLTVIATRMHLSKEFGYTVKEIEKDGLKIKKVPAMIEKDTLSAMIKTFAVEIFKISDAIEEIKPDIIFVEADRGENLAGAITGAHLNIPVVHHGGGDESKSIDNKVRNAMTMFADYHLAGNKSSYEKLLKIGISKNKVFLTGEPGLDDIFYRDFAPKKEIMKKYGLDPEKPFILLIQHPNTEEYGKTKRQIEETLSAIKKLKIQTVAIFSNADAGGRTINSRLLEFAGNFPFFKVFPNFERREFLGLINACDAMVGNSSAGIVELPSFKKPFICVGTRESQRLRAGNTIDVGYDRKRILMAINKALYNKKFIEKIKKINNPYGDGRSSERIAKIILKKIAKEI